jgi:hypothetical protein
MRSCFVAMGERKEEVRIERGLKEGGVFDPPYRKA